VLLSMAVTVPVLFVFVMARGRGNATVSMAGTLLGVYWIGLAASHGVLLRQLPHGDGVMIDVLVGTFMGDTGAFIGGRPFGRRPGPRGRGAVHDRGRLLRVVRRHHLSTRHLQSARMPRRLAILGSTGSIGVQALDVVSRSEGELEVVALSAARAWEPLVDQAR